MACLSNFNETPNLLELVEVHHNGFPSSLSDISFCADEGNDLDAHSDQSICADEISSDVRLKTDIEQVGTTVYGLPLYHFRYKTGTARFVGVMAQDVLEVMPDAVVVGGDGYFRVKYDQLGIRMTRASG
jgi:hypothetical protein